jgi:hypothetical protein
MALRQTAGLRTSVLAELSYAASRQVAGTLASLFARHVQEAAQHSSEDLATPPNAEDIGAIIDAGFWASLRREEGYSPKISLAFFPPEQASTALRFETQLPLTPATLSRLAPAVERPGIHLGVWRSEGELKLWGTSLMIPRSCFVLEVIQPGLLVVKYRRGHGTGKYVNVAVLEGDQIKILDERESDSYTCPWPLYSLLGFGTSADTNAESVNVMVQLAASMRAHGRGGSLLVVPYGDEAWRKSIIWPAPYAVSPAYRELADLVRQDAETRKTRLWQESIFDAVEAMAGLTAVDGATVINDQYELLAFGAKIGRRDGGSRVDEVIVTEPVVGHHPSVTHPLQLGGTRHLSAAQFVRDQRDSVALVASQDGRFTVFAWSTHGEMVHAHRVESLLL